MHNAQTKTSTLASSAGLKDMIDNARTSSNETHNNVSCRKDTTHCRLLASDSPLPAWSFT